jgi:ATPase subunit of ABC transporter with duplicated ATPase domains
VARKLAQALPEGTLVVISHDREFLDAITNVTVHIDAGKLTRYGGNYSTFEDMRAQQMELQQNAYAKQQDKIAHLQKFIPLQGQGQQGQAGAEPGQGARPHGASGARCWPAPISPSNSRNRPTCRTRCW